MNDIEQVIAESLSSEQQIEPSPFFAARTMSLVRREAELPPLPFPRKRIAALVILLIAAVVMAISLPADSDPLGGDHLFALTALVAMVSAAAAAVAYEIRSRLTSSS